MMKWKSSKNGSNAIAKDDEGSTGFGSGFFERRSSTSSRLNSSSSGKVVHSEDTQNLRFQLKILMRENETLKEQLADQKTDRLLLRQTLNDARFDLDNYRTSTERRIDALLQQVKEKEQSEYRLAIEIQKQQGHSQVLQSQMEDLLKLHHAQTMQLLKQIAATTASKPPQEILTLNKSDNVEDTIKSDHNPDFNSIQASKRNQSIHAQKLRGISIIFADISDIFQVSDNSATQQALKVMQKFDEAYQKLCTKYNAVSLDSHLGDTFLAAIGLPMISDEDVDSKDDDPTKAAVSALAFAKELITAAETMCNTSDGNETPDGAEIPLKLSLHSGEVTRLDTSSHSPSKISKAMKYFGAGIKIATDMKFAQNTSKDGIALHVSDDFFQLVSENEDVNDWKGPKGICLCTHAGEAKIWSLQRA